MTPSRISDNRCPQCGNPGFAWERPYCQYCGVRRSASDTGNSPPAAAGPAVGADMLDRQQQRFARHMTAGRPTDIVLTVLLTLVAVFAVVLEEFGGLSGIESGYEVYALGDHSVLWETGLLALAVAGITPLLVYRAVRAFRAKRFWTG